LAFAGLKKNSGYQGGIISHTEKSGVFPTEYPVGALSYSLAFTSML
jgi:hypothetical protein